MLRSLELMTVHGPTPFMSIYIIKQDLKNIKNVKGCRDGMPKKYANKVGIVHESKGQHIGKTLFLHLFHTAVRQHV